MFIGLLKHINIKDKNELSLKYNIYVPIILFCALNKKNIVFLHHRRMYTLLF